MKGIVSEIALELVKQWREKTTSHRQKATANDRCHRQTIYHQESSPALDTISENQKGFRVTRFFRVGLVSVFRHSFRATEYFDYFNAKIQKFSQSSKFSPPTIHNSQQ